MQVTGDHVQWQPRESRMPKAVITDAALRRELAATRQRLAVLEGELEARRVTTLWPSTDQLAPRENPLFVRACNITAAAIMAVPVVLALVVLAKRFI